MMAFWASVGLALVVALALLFRPFWLRSLSAHGAGVTRQQINAAIYREQLQRLEKDKAEGTLSEADYAAACAELERRVLEDTAQSESITALPMPKKTVWGLAALVPLTAIGLYLGVGNVAAVNPEPVAAKNAPTLADLERMVAGLAKRLENEPNNLEGWVMLARSYKMLGHNAQSEAAFDRAAPLVEKDAQLLAMYADVAAQNAEGNFAGKPMVLIEKALKLDPESPMALWLYGTAAAQKKDFGTAIQTWERLLQQLEPQSEDWNMLKGAIDAARKAAAGGEVKGK